MKTMKLFTFAIFVAILTLNACSAEDETERLDVTDDMQGISVIYGEDRHIRINII